MTTSEAIKQAYALQIEWVGKNEGGGFNLERIHASILQDHRWNVKTPARCTPACASRTFGHLILLGKIRKTLGRQG